MTRPYLRFAVCACVLSLAACTGDAAEQAAVDAPGQTPAPAVRVDEDASTAAVDTPATRSSDGADPSTGAATVGISDTYAYGQLLADAEGMSLYVFMDDDGESACVDACADAWPPLLADGDPVAGTHVRDELLGTTGRPDGAQQVTYDGRPLYRFSGDSATGDVLGFGNGEAWYPIAADGTVITATKDSGGTDEW